MSEKYKKFHISRSWNRGYTFIEALVVIGISALLIAAVVVFYARGVQRNREQFEQVLVSEDIRVNMDRIADAIRNTKEADDGSLWLVEANADSLEFYTNIDADSGVEQVRYSLSGSDLQRTVIDDDGTEKMTTLASSIRNGDGGPDLFAYYDGDGNVLAVGNRTAFNVARIDITLKVDVTENNNPPAAIVRTSAVPRQTLSSANNALSLGEAIINLPADTTTVGSAQISLTDAQGLNPQTEVVSIIDMNNNRLKLFTDGTYVNVNYLNNNVAPSEGVSPGWYAWIGPMLLGKSGQSSYYDTARLSTTAICTGNTLQIELSDRGVCPFQTLSRGSLIRKYLPILTYTDNNGDTYYVRSITDTYAP